LSIIFARLIDSMETGAAMIISVLLVVLLLIAFAYLWYNYTGWRPFVFGNGDKVAFSSKQSVSKLRFKNCIFTVVDPSNQKHTYDVTRNLNGMAVAYKGSPRPPRQLELGGVNRTPLNAFTFTVPGVNDRATLPTAEDIKIWSNSSVALSGQWREI